MSVQTIWPGEWLPICTRNHTSIEIIGVGETNGRQIIVDLADTITKEYKQNK